MMDTLEFIKETHKGGLNGAADTAFVKSFEATCVRLGMDKADPKLITLAYDSYMTGIIHLGKTMVNSKATSDMLATLPTANLPKA